MRNLLSCIFALLLFSANAQGFRVRHHIAGTSANSTKTLLETSPGNYFGAGIVSDSLTGTSQLCVVGLGAQGQLTWTKKYGTSQLQYYHNTFIGKSFYKFGSHIYYAGSAQEPNNNRTIGVLIKFSLTGDTLWQKIYRDLDTLEDVMPQMLTASVDGGFLITGIFQNWGTNATRCLLIKTDANGNELWRKKIAKVVPDTQDGKTILQDSASKKIVIAGYQYIGNSNSWSPYPNVLILDSLGIKINQLNYGVKGTMMDLIQTKDKKIICVGTKNSAQQVAGFYLETAFVVKFDLYTPSVSLWTANFDQLELINQFTNVLEMPNGDLLFGGMMDTIWPTTGDANCRIKLIKLNQNGILKWKRYYDYKINPPNFSNFLSLRSLHITSDGSLIGAIESANYPDPNPLFFVRWDSTGCDSTLVYCQSQATVSTVGVKMQHSDEDLGISVFPNPTTNLLTIKSQDNTNEFFISITDLTGRKVKEEILMHGQITITMKELSAGVYLISLSKDKKIVYRTKVLKQE